MEFADDLDVRYRKTGVRGESQFFGQENLKQRVAIC